MIKLTNANTGSACRFLTRHFKQDCCFQFQYYYPHEVCNLCVCNKWYMGWRMFPNLFWDQVSPAQSPLWPLYLLAIRVNTTTSSKKNLSSLNVLWLKGHELDICRSKYRSVACCQVDHFWFSKICARDVIWCSQMSVILPRPLDLIGTGLELALCWRPRRLLLAKSSVSLRLWYEAVGLQRCLDTSLLLCLSESIKQRLETLLLWDIMLLSPL